MSLYGTQELSFQRFGGGLALDVDPTEIDDDQASDLENVDLRSYGIDLRKGRTAIDGTAPVFSKVNGAHAYYSRDGVDRMLLLQVDTALYEYVDTPTPGFSATATDLMGDAPFDFVQYREALYGGSSADLLRKRAVDTGEWSPVGLITAPVPPVVGNYQPVIESFDNSTLATGGDIATGWVRTDITNIVISATTDEKREGSASLEVAFKNVSGTAKGDSLTKRWSLGESVDLSKVEALVLWYQANKSGATFQVGILPNNPATTLTAAISNGTVDTAVLTSVAGYEVGDYIRVDSEVMKVLSVDSVAKSLKVARGQEGTSGVSHSNGTVVNQAVNFSLFSQFATVGTSDWTALKVPLASLPPSRRTASAGIGIKFLTPGKSGFDTVLTFDQCVAMGPLVTDDYSYYATYLASGTYAESNPSPAATLKVEENPPTLGGLISPAASTEPGVDVIRLWRYRRYGTFRKARLIGTLPNGPTTVASGLDAEAAATSFTITSPTGITPGCVLHIDDEDLLVTGVDESTLTVTRAWGGTTAATHDDAVTVACTRFLDLRSDGSIALEDPDELVDGKIAPPLAATYALVNARLYAGNVTLAEQTYPWRIYVSRTGFPEEFSSVSEPNKGPTVAGWLDVPSKDHIRRILEFEGQAIVFCDRSIWSIVGSGWDDFAIYKRAEVGLDAREAVAVDGRTIYFLASDGVRVLEPNSGGFEGSFPTWVISEPVDSRLRSIPHAERHQCAMGIDERGRLHLSLVRSGQAVPDAALIFDPYLPGATLSGQFQPARRGWTYYTNWGFSLFLKLKRGGGDAGQLLGGDATAAQLHYLQRSKSDEELTDDDGAAIPWSWTSKAQDAGAGKSLEWVFLGVEADANAGASTTLNDAGGISATDGTAVVTSASGLAVGEYLQIGSEVLLITGVAENTLTVTRGQAGTTAAAHADGAAVTLVRVLSATPVLDGGEGAALELGCGPSPTGFVALTRRLGAAVRGRFNQLKLSGAHRTAIRIRSARVGGWVKG